MGIMYWVRRLEFLRFFCVECRDYAHGHNLQLRPGRYKNYLGGISLLSTDHQFTYHSIYHWVIIPFDGGFKNQAVTFLVLLGYIACTLFFLSIKYNNIFDYMAFRMPLMYSDFIGFGNLEEILMQRGIYFLSGISFIFLTILLIKRLPQSKAMSIFHISRCLHC